MAWIAAPMCREIGRSQLDTRSGRSLLKERYRALQRQIPLLYMIILVNLVGLHLTSFGRLPLDNVPVMVVVAVVAVRLVQWLRRRQRQMDAEEIRQELWKTMFFCVGLNVVFCAWTLQIFDQGSADQQTFVAFFSSLAAVGCAHGLSSFPTAARIPILLVVLPLSFLLVGTQDPQNIAVGVSLALLGLLVLRLLTVHEDGFVDLVQSRSAIAEQRERARQAEAAANAERARATLIAETDHLTGLPNRRALISWLDRMAGAAPAEADMRFAVALLDLDGFKPINDTFGHAAGDVVLQQVGKRLQDAAGPVAIVGRMGGDEFALILPGCRDGAAARKLAQSACLALQPPFEVEGRHFRLSGSCGVTVQTAGRSDSLRALMEADTALYRAKERRRGGIALFSPHMQDARRRRSAIEASLRDAATLGEIDLVFQPIFHLETMALRSFEALARWHSPKLGEIPPGEFIPIAEQSGAIAHLSDLLFLKAIREAKSWPDSIRLSFNLSAVQLCTLDCADRLLAVLAEEGMEPGRLKIEVTETALLGDFELARANLDRLRSRGVRIVLDDFGAGHASISYLREMRFDAVKLDGSLLGEVAQAGSGRRLLKGVLELCSSLGTSCVAECIETPEQLALLRELECKAGQGFLLGRPMAAAEAASFAASRIVGLAGRRRREKAAVIAPELRAGAA